jgi:hypothetical protein
MEYWNCGMMGLKKQNSKRKLLHCFSCFDGVFYGVKTENKCLVWIIQNVDPTFMVESAVFRFPYPVFQHSTIPSFHAAYQEDDRKNHCNSNRL